jgi:hypothetical protein
MKFIEAPMSFGLQGKEKVGYFYVWFQSQRQED